MLHLHKLHKARKLHRRARPHLRPRMQRRMRTAVAVFGLALGAVSAAHAQVVVTRKALTETSPSTAALGLRSTESPEALDARWRESLDAFDALDRASAPAPGGVVFVGSSSIRLWDGLEQAFASEGRTVVKRGFGGSRLLDCARYAARLVVAYQPRAVVVYAGDNDLAEGASADDVLARYRAFVAQVHAALPGTVITYVSIKPSPSRAALMAAAVEANARIAAWSRDDPRLRFVDVYTRMLDADGRPRADLFLPDALHLNAAGYAIWKEAIGASLR